MASTTEKRVIFRMDEHMVKLVDNIANKLGETRAEFTRQAWLLRIQHLKNSSILTALDEIINEEKNNGAGE